MIEVLGRRLTQLFPIDFLVLTEEAYVHPRLAGVGLPFLQYAVGLDSAAVHAVVD